MTPDEKLLADELARFDPFSSNEPEAPASTDTPQLAAVSNAPAQSPAQLAAQFEKIMAALLHNNSTELYRVCDALHEANEHVFDAVVRHIKPQWTRDVLIVAEFAAITSSEGVNSAALAGVDLLVNTNKPIPLAGLEYAVKTIADLKRIYGLNSLLDMPADWIDRFMRPMQTSDNSEPLTAPKRLADQRACIAHAIHLSSDQVEKAGLQIYSDALEKKSYFGSTST